MGRTLLGVLGIVVALSPDRVRAVYERVAFAAPEDPAGKPWLRGAIRGEGVVIVLACLLGGRAYRWLMGAMGAAGLAALLFPERYLDVGVRVAYESPEEIGWRDGFVTVARGLGALYVLAALRYVRRCRAEA